MGCGTLCDCIQGESEILLHALVAGSSIENMKKTYINIGLQFLNNFLDCMFVRNVLNIPMNALYSYIANFPLESPFYFRQRHQHWNLKLNNSIILFYWTSFELNPAEKSQDIFGIITLISTRITYFEYRVITKTKFVVQLAEISTIRSAFLLILKRLFWLLLPMLNSHECDSIVLSRWES